MNFQNKMFVVGIISLLSSAANAELMGYWSGDGHTNDGLGNNNGTLINEATYGNGYLNEAFLFDGDTDSVYLGTGLDVTTEFTLSARFNLFGFGGERQIFNNESAYEIAIQGDEIKVALMTSDIPWYWIDTGWKVNLNEWTYVSMTYDGTAINLYDELGTERFHQAYTGIVSNGSAARIGARSFDNSGFNGMIDEVSLYNTAITPQNGTIMDPSSDISASVPVPASIGLLALAMLGFSARRKSK